MSQKALLKAIVRGRVQGVYFRAFVARGASRLGLRGYVRNLADGSSVEVNAEGERPALEKLLEHLKSGPPGARVDEVGVEWGEAGGEYGDFAIRY